MRLQFSRLTTALCFSKTRDYITVALKKRRKEEEEEEEKEEAKNWVFSWLTVFGRLREVFSVSQSEQTVDTPLDTHTPRNMHVSAHAYKHTHTPKGIVKRS